MANTPMPELGATLSEGKTKRIIEIKGDPTRVVLWSKDDITAGDGAKHDVIPDKGKIANRTTCNVFRLLAGCGVPVAFDPSTCGVDWFAAPRCQMLPYEVVVRREGHGSYLKRHPHLSKGQLFPRLIVEFFLKTKDKRWKQHTLICDDPFMLYNAQAGTIALFHPGKPVRAEDSFLTLQAGEVFSSADEARLFEPMARIARETFLVLEKAWQLQGRKLVDMKVEFGLTATGELLLADVIDNDSWRVVDGGAYIDKQVYRDGGAISEVTQKYQLVAELTSRFALPTQRIIVWSGSVKDDVSPVVDAVKKLSRGQVPTVAIACSVHKEPVRGMLELSRLAQEVPDTVVIAYIGMSNGAGPTLAANTTAPVITIPAGYDKFPDDVWSSLRTPSNVPVLTVLNPSNAALAALEILALRNPAVYAALRLELEERLTNVVVL